MKVETTETHTTHKVTLAPVDLIVLAQQQLPKSITEAGAKQNVRVMFTVPSGGDCSGMSLNLLDEHLPIEVYFTYTS